MSRKIYSIYCIFMFLILFLFFIFYFYFISLKEYILANFKGNISFKKKLFIQFYYGANYFFRLWNTVCGHQYILAANLVENLRKINYLPHIIIANHSSYLDIPAIFYLSSQKPIYILAKSEGVQIPIFKYIYNTITVSFHRKKISQIRKAMSKVENYLKEGGSLFVFPEGGFDNYPTILKPFKLGAFDLAIKYKLPIFSIVIRNSSGCLAPDSILSFKPGKIHLQNLAIITEHLNNEMTAADLKEYCYRLYIERKLF